MGRDCTELLRAVDRLGCVCESHLLFLLWVWQAVWLAGTVVVDGEKEILKKNKNQISTTGKKTQLNLTCKLPFLIAEHQQ